MLRTSPLREGLTIVRHARSSTTISLFTLAIGIALVSVIVGYAVATSISATIAQSPSDSTTSRVSATLSSSLVGTSSNDSTNLTTTSVTSTAATNSASSSPGQNASSSGDLSSIMTAQFGNTTAKDVLQACAGFGDPNPVASCKLPNPVGTGDILLVAVAEIPSVLSAEPTTTNTTNSESPPGSQTLNQTMGQGPVLSDSIGDDFDEVGQAPGQPGNTYSFYYFVANITTDSGSDQVTLAGSGNYPFIFVHELRGVTRVIAFSSGNGNSSSASVSSYVPPAGSLVLSTIWVENDAGVADAGVEPGHDSALLDNAFAVTEEYSTASGGPLTPAFSLTSSVPWGEISVALD